MSTPRILIVDDDVVLSDLLTEYLSSEACEVLQASDGLQALEIIAKDAVDIVVLDIMMPNLNGIDTLKNIRGKSMVPVIMLTARGDDLDRILGLELGADDYLSKPCNPRELYARIKAVLRRSTINSTEQPNKLVVADITLDPKSRVLTVADTNVPLTQTEFDLLYLLLSTPDQLITKADMSFKVLGKKLSQWDRSIDVHISNLRKKLGPHPGGQERIRTIRGSGYLFASSASES